MASEVGKAYVTLLPSAKGFASRMQSELAGDIAKVGKSLGDDLGEKIGDEAGKETTSRLSKALSGAKGKLIGAVSGLAIGGAITKGLSDALGQDALNAKLTAQLGLTQKQSAKVGKVAGNLFAGGYGEGIDQINEGIRSVVQNIDGMRGASASALERISGKVVTTAQVFDQDLGGVTRAVAQLMRTGMAKNADEALDIITRGFQTGADKSEDFLDTLNEYGTQFRKLGIDGKTATGLISQGLKAGARDGDIVADAIKEFSIRAIDGSDATKAGFKALGLSAKDMQKQIAGGGKGASKGLDTVLDKLRSVKDPAKQAAIATSLFGTQSEDLGKALFKLDPSKAAKGLGQVKGAADRANASFNDTPTAVVGTFFRQLQQGAVNIMARKVIPVIEDLLPILSDLGGAFQSALTFIKPALTFLKDNTGVVIGVGVAIGALTALTYAHAAAMAFSSGAAKAWFVQTKIISAATKAWAAVQWVLNASIWANPVTWIVAGIVALIAVIVLVATKTQFFQKAWDLVWGAVKTAFSAAFNFIKQNWPLILAILTGPIGLAVLAIVKNWDKIKAGASALVGWFKKLPGRIGNALSSLGGVIGRAFSSAISAGWHLVQRGVSMYVDAFTSIPGKLLRLGGLFLDAGKHVIQSFIDGLKNAAGLVSDVAGNIWNAVKTLLNDGIDKLNAALEFRISVLGKGVTINPPDIPHLAGGGRATAGTLAVIGEGREPETVLPDSMLRGLLERAAGQGAVGHLTITNWRDGTGYFRLVAEESLAADNRFRRDLGAMHA